VFETVIQETTGRADRQGQTGGTSRQDRMDGQAGVTGRRDRQERQAGETGVWNSEARGRWQDGQEDKIGRTSGTGRLDRKKTSSSDR
jgi:hypothetical protein